MPVTWAEYSRMQKTYSLNSICLLTELPVYECQLWYKHVVLSWSCFSKKLCKQHYNLYTAFMEKSYWISPWNSLPATGKKSFTLQYFWGYWGSDLISTAGKGKAGTLGWNLRCPRRLWWGLSGNPPFCCSEVGGCQTRFLGF